MKGLSDWIVAVLVVLVVDAWLFHPAGGLGGAYFDDLQPASYAGRAERDARRLEARFAEEPATRWVLTTGDSTAGGGILAGPLEERLRFSGVDLRAFDLAQPGSTSRTWYFLLKSLDLRSDRVATVVVGLFPTALRNFPAPKDDLAIVKTRLGVGDLPAMARSYEPLEQRIEILSGAFFRMPWFRRDLRELLGDPAARFAAIERSRRVAARGRPTGRPTGSVASARLGPDDRLVVDELDPHLHRNPYVYGPLEQWLRNRRRPVDRSIDFDPRKLRLLRRLVEHLDDREITTVIAVLPKIPAVFEHRNIGPIETLVEELQERDRNVRLFRDEALLDRLETDAYFADHIHLNEAGASAYTEALADFLVGSLGRGEAGFRVSAF